MFAITKKLIATFAILAITAVASAQKTHTFTIRANEDGTVTQEHDIRVEFQDPSTPLAPPVVIWIHVPKYTDTETIAGEIEARVNDRLEYEPDHLESKEVTEGDKKLSHSIVVPKAIREFKIESWREGGDRTQIDHTIK